uniref:CFAP65 fourth Ig-like domain-containing protein n=1 Tax=Astyanax mexicanus TaxID=7994 RepID=A0A3B1KIF3_ASTMX
MDPRGYGVFTVDQISGTIAANSSLTLHLRFRPHHSIAYHRRTACLILHREPLFLDLIGTCHSEQLKPAILCPRHLRVYRLNLLRGLTCYPPDILSAMLDEHKLQLDEKGGLVLQEDTAFFPLPHVTVQPSELTFYAGPASQSVSITNHTKGKLTLLWTPASDSPFSIGPLSCDLSPLKSTDFRVTYTPRQHNIFHAAQLECFAVYKVNRASREQCSSLTG